MNFHALSHMPQSRDAFHIDRNATVIRFRAARGDLAKVDLFVKRKYDEKPLGSIPMTIAFSDTLFDYYHAVIPTDFGRRVYYFELTDNSGDKYCYTENGVQKPEEISPGYFPHFQIPFLSESDIHRVPDKFRNATVYQIFTDRFHTAKPKCDWTKKPTPFDFFGGDLYGVKDKLNYIKDLGIDCIYFTPINPSRTNHHYDVEDYYHVAKELGGDDAFKAVVDGAHKLGMTVMLDGVFNHCSAANPMFVDVREKGRASEYYDWFLIDGDKPQAEMDGWKCLSCNYQTFANKVAYMPKLNCDNVKVREFVKDVTVHWMKEFNIDAWRLDVADDIAPALWREVRGAIKGYDNNAIMIGEDWMDPYAFLQGDVFDGVMNYGFARAARDYLAYKTADADVAAERLVRTYLRTSKPAADMMLNLIGCHDTHRFLHLCGGDVFSFNAAMAMMFFYDGMPMVYYGDELPMDGGADPDCRRGFEWNRVGSDTSKLITRLSAMRKGESKDTVMKISASDGALVMTRKTGDKTNRLIVNVKADKAKISGDTVPAKTVYIDIDGEHIEFSAK
ncbi:MAG: glycoside hydrolase family 13 protein [Clostridiales bacterium]|nr:glycoside hydrolase family 13 protein [Clostridiales bacterium]